MELKIERVPIDSIQVYAKNAKLHPAEQIEQIKKSIQDFGNNDPIAVWGKDSTIVEGHGRYIALKELGYEEVDIIRLDHLSDEQRRAYALVHNKLTMNSPFDIDMLSIELEDIDIDMTEFGFEEAIDFNEDALNDLFTDAPEKEKEPKKIQCPHCGEWFEVE